MNKKSGSGGKTPWTLREHSHAGKASCTEVITLNVQYTHYLYMCIRSPVYNRSQGITQNMRVRPSDTMSARSQESRNSVKNCR